MNRLFLVLTIVSIAVVGCSSTGGQAGMGGEGGTGGTEPKCKTPQEMLRCDKVTRFLPTIRRSKTAPTCSSWTSTRRSTT